MRRAFIILTMSLCAGLCVGALSSCITAKDVARIESVASNMRAREAAVAAALDSAQVALDALKAAGMDPAAVEKAEGVVAMLRTTLETANAAAADAETAAAQARKTLESGGGFLDVVLQVGLGLLGGGGIAGGIAAKLLGRWRGVAVAGIQLAQALKHPAEAQAPKEAEDAVAKAAAVNARLGMTATVDAIRRGVAA